MHVDDVSCLFLHVCTDSLFYLTGNIHANRPTVGLKSHSHSQEFKIVPLSSGDGWPNHRLKRCLIAPILHRPGQASGGGTRVAALRDATDASA